MAFEFLGLPSEGRQRDKRRSFTRTQKNEALEKQNHKCARCHKKLDLCATHFHHKASWESGGRTVTRNEAALCANCHSIATHYQRLNKVEGKGRRKTQRKQTNPLDEITRGFKQPKLGW
ncbi:MAG: HNH endonuclease [Nitrososphaerota archaeon]|nr:HNH endonuclease [Nitrososphaerota archaeon]